MALMEQQACWHGFDGAASLLARALMEQQACCTGFDGAASLLARALMERQHFLVNEFSQE